MKILITGGSGFIGTNLITELEKNKKHVLLNIDIKSPKIDSHDKYWKHQDIRERTELLAIFQEFEADLLIHLAARTDLNGEHLDDYSTNTLGTENIIQILNEVNFKGRAIFTSSMYVCEPGYKPVDFNDYKPHTIYGESKVKSEEIIKLVNKDYTWIIIRPTSIWGPWFSDPYSDFFKIVLSKKYFHLGNKICEKTYGYVENTVAQIISLSTIESEKVNGNTYYLGDDPCYNIAEWAIEIADTIPYKIKKIPFILFHILGLFGDVCKKIGVKFPMTSFRLKNMTTDNVHNLEPIYSILEKLPFSRINGINKTVNWLENQKCR